MQHPYLNPPVKPFGGFSARNRKVKLLGVPLDTTTSYRPGSRFAPQAIRLASDYMELCTVFGDCLFEREGIDDLGDVVPVVDSVDRTLMVVREVVGKAVSSGARVIALGGDHTVTIGVVEGIYEAVKKPMCMCVVDAHLDLRDELCGKYSHATTMRRVLERVEIDRIVWFGVRAFSSEELDYLRNLGSKAMVLRSIEILENPKKSLESVVSFVKECKALYLSIDLDGVDPAYAPGVQTPEPLGIEPRHLFQLVKLLSTRAVGADIVEVSPPNDPSGATVALAVKLIVEIATGMIRGREGLEG